MATYQAEGVTLLARKYQGTGRIVVFFTRQRGKVEAVAQGVGKPGSTLAPAVELFARSQLFFAEGRNLDRLTQARVIESFEPLRRDPLRLGYAGFVCELYAMATEPGEPIEGAFEDLVVFLRQLSQGGPVVPLTTALVWRFLGCMGVAPELDRCGRCGRELERAESARFVPGEGAVVCNACGGGLGDALQVPPRLRALAKGLGEFSIDRIERIKVSEEEWSRLLLIARLQVQFHLGLELKSAEFLRQVADK